jgi:cell division protein FtsB
MAVKSNLIQQLKQHAWKPISAATFVWLMYQLWFDATGIFANISMAGQINNQHEINMASKARNQVLIEEIQAIKSGVGAIEAKARKELGMVKKDETYFLVVEKKK